jgi:hypothetical protein
MRSDLEETSSYSVNLIPYPSFEVYYRNLIKTIDKSIITLKMARRKMATIVENSKKCDWVLREILLDGKNILDVQINVLIKQRMKYKKRSLLPFLLRCSRLPNNSPEASTFAMSQNSTRTS